MNARLVERHRLTAGEREAMFFLLARHFEGLRRERFELDLAQKSAALLLENGHGELAGFSTLLLFDAEVGNEPITVVFSGDTVVDPAARLSPLLARAWIAAVRELASARAPAPARRLLWLLICSGFRTYRLLPLFWREFWPRPERETPAEEAQRIEELAARLFGPAWDREAGVVRPAEPQVLRNGLGDVAPGRLADPFVAYFLRRNPGWLRGDELVCLTELSEANLTAAGRRAWGG